MPIYEYQCRSCGHQMEAFQKVSEAALTECPECHQGTLNKLISAAGFQLKGSGWYMTDYRNKEKTTDKTESGGSENKAANDQAASGTEPASSPASTDQSNKNSSDGGNQSAASS